MESQSDIRYRIKTANAADILLHLQECDESFVSPLSQKVKLPAYAEKIESNAVTFEAWQDSTLAGLIAAYFNDSGSGIGFITNVSVSPDQTGKGIASSLMKRCTTYARDHGFNKIQLEVAAGNTAAVELYKKFNFSEISLKDDCLVMEHLVENKPE